MQKTVRSRSIVALLLMLLTAGFLFLLGACAADEPQDAPAREDAVHRTAESASEPTSNTGDSEESAEAAPADAGPETYTVRGEIVDLPDPDDPTSGFFVYHEAIDDFRGMDGQISGMSSMTMPFPVAEDVDLEGLGRGDKVEFDLYVDWDGDPATRVTRVEKLPDDTILEFRGAQPPSGPGAED